MSKYTTELRFICENYAGLTESVGYDKVDWVIQNSRSKVFSFQYPIFDESYRSVLESKILKHYYTKEICAETVGRWKLFLESRMIEIMPYYNLLYDAQIELLKHNLFDDTDYTIDYKGKGLKDGNKNGNTSSQDSGKDSANVKDTPVRDTWELFSDTPQGDVVAMDNDEYRYLTNAVHTITDGKGSNRDSEYEYGRKNVGSISERNIINSTDDYIKHIFGKVNPRSYANLYREYVDNILNIDMEIIGKLKDLFFNLW